MERAFITGVLLWSVWLQLQVNAQWQQIARGHIKTLQVVAVNKWMELPIIQLHANEVVHIDFDDLSHEKKRYAYRVEHCEADWTPSVQLFESDYLEGFAEGNIIDDMMQSVNTNTLYTHYHLQLPNSQCQFKIGGNYRVSVFDEQHDHDKVLEACFMVVDPQMTIGMSVTGNTDVDIHRKRQQLSLDLQFNACKVNNWQQELKTVTLQNACWETAVTNPTPQYVKTNGLQWTHHRQLIFPAGNEYHKFEMLDVDRVSMGLERVAWDGKAYHAYLQPDLPKPNYLYDEDANGAFFIRNSDNVDIHTTSDYLYVHFKLQIPQQLGQIYLNGRWTERLMPTYRMIWNEQDACYEATVLLKQGYYNYRYLLVKPDGSILPLPYDGCFSETENTYTTLVYYRPFGGRTDILVAVGSVNTKK